MSIKNLFFWSYWFKQPYLLHGGKLAAWVIIFLVVTLGGLVALFLKIQQSEQALRKFWARAAGCLLTMGITGLIWLFFRQEQVPFLAWRFWVAVWVIIFAVWFIPLLVYYFKRVPVIRAENAARAERERYLR